MDELAPIREAACGVGWRKLVAGAASAAPVSLRRGPAVKVVEGPRTETVPLAEWPERLDALLAAAENVHLLGPEGDLHARRTKKGRWLVSRGRASSIARPRLAHDRGRNYPLPQDDPLFVATGLVSPEGRLRAAHADKYRQVQHYIELLRPLAIWDSDGPLRVVDAGCGKAYMSLALYAYARARGREVALVGIDRNEEVVETVRRIAGELGYEGARFEAATIADYAARNVGPIDLLVSLHACDTATDEAIAAGVKLGARAIVVAPCCHRELAAQIESRPRDAVLRHGLLLGRQADILTDALRASALESLGYRADAIEFVAAEHTAKNLMIRAELRDDAAARERARREYRELADLWQVEPSLERLVGGLA